jgi:hypothetical protein
MEEVLVGSSRCYRGDFAHVLGEDVVVGITFSGGDPELSPTVGGYVEGVVGSLGGLE